MRKRIVTAQEALELGLVHEVVEDGELLPRALDLARELANGPQVAMRLLKRSIYNAAEMTWAQSLDEIAAKTAIGDHHPDAREGIAAFREKRQPKFNAWLETGGEDRRRRVSARALGDTASDPDHRDRDPRPGPARDHRPRAGAGALLGRVSAGLCTIMIQHTSASLVIQENADPSARRDLEAWLDRLVPENDPLYTHRAEGPDDMPSHIKGALTATTLSIPIVGSAGSRSAPGRECSSGSTAGGGRTRTLRHPHRDLTAGRQRLYCAPLKGRTA